MEPDKLADIIHYLNQNQQTGTIVFKPINIPPVPKTYSRRMNKFTYWLGIVFMKFMGWRIRGQLPAQKQYIMAIAPHTSNWDFVVSLATYFCLRVKMCFMMKETIFRWPFEGILKHWGGIPIERSKKHGVVGQMVEKFKNQPDLIIALAPEGTRKKVEKWKTGFLQMAHQAKVPLFLVGLDYKTKEVILGPLMEVGADIEKALAEAQAFYASINPKFPENFCTSTN